MGFYEHLTTFAGLPVFDFPIDDEDDIAAGLAEPTPYPDDIGSVAWRVNASTSDDAYDFDALFELFLQKVDTTRVRALVIGAWHEYGGPTQDSPVAKLVESAPRFPELTAIFFGDIVSEESEVAYLVHPQIAPILEAYPRLQEFWIRGSEESNGEPSSSASWAMPASHASLRVLVFQSGGLSGTTMRALGKARFPALEHLEIYFGHEWYGGDGTVADIEWLLSGEEFPRLRYLGLRDSLHQDAVAEAVADSPIVARLDVLDLSLGTLGDEGGAALLAGQPLTHLKKLDLHHHFMSQTMADRVVAALPGVEVDVSGIQEPQTWTAADGQVQETRFIAISE